MSSAISVPNEVRTPSRPLASPRRCALLIFFFFNFLYLLTSTGRVRTLDEYMTFFETDSLVLRHSTAVPQAVRLNYYYGKADDHGQPRAPYSPGHPLFAAPWYVLGQALSHLPGVPPQCSDLVLEAAVCFSSAAFCAATIAFLFLIFCSMRLDYRLSFLTASIVGIATPVFAYSSWFFSEPLCTALLVAAAYFVFARHIGEPIPIRSAAIGGTLLGLAVFVRPAHALASIAFFVALLLRDRSKALKPAFALAAVSAIGLAVLLLYNFHIFGSALEFGYPSAAEAGKRLNSFETPVFTGLRGLLFSPGKSIFVFAPPIVLAVAGIARLWRVDRGLASLSALTLPLYLVFYARYTQWEGGYCVGPRYLVPALTMLCIALGPMLAEASTRTRAVVIALTVMGATVQFLSIATSFMESQAPIGVYYDQNWNYRMSYSVWSQAEVLLRHLTQHAPARLGLGFDRWFLFLGKAGVSPLTLTYGVALFALAATLSGLAVRRLVVASQR